VTTQTTSHVALAHLLASTAGTSGDPLYAHGVGWFVWAVVLIKVLVAFVVLLVSVLLMIWFERKVISDMQSRIGPNRAGPWGLLQTLADGTKLFFKEDLSPERADHFVFRLAPYLSLIPVFLMFTVIPVGGVVEISGHQIELQVADPPIGILLVLAMSSIAVYGVMLAGWSSGSKYPLLGSVRASAQMVSYEAALGLTVVAVVLITGSLSTRAIVDSQAPNFWDWNLIRLGFVPFFLFMISITAELTRPPFDLTEADSELVGGFNTEYSSIRFALFFLAEFMAVVVMSGVVVTLFLGGPDGPIPRFIPTSDVWMPSVWFLVKVLIFLFVYVWLRAALPRLRYDQLMDLGWKRLIPLSLGWLLIVAGVVQWHWNGLWVALAVVMAAALMTISFSVGAEREQAGGVLPPVGPRLGALARHRTGTPGPPPPPAVQGPPGAADGPGTGAVD
jgi:NADH-quinone oxidoreductase subunit H